MGLNRERPTDVQQPTIRPSGRPAIQMRAQQGEPSGTGQPHIAQSSPPAHPRETMSSPPVPITDERSTTVGWTWDEKAGDHAQTLQTPVLFCESRHQEATGQRRCLHECGAPRLRLSSRGLPPCISTIHQGSLTRRTSESEKLYHLARCESRPPARQNPIGTNSPTTTPVTIAGKNHVALESKTKTSGMKSKS